MQLPSDALEAAELLRHNGWPQDAMEDVAAGRAKLIPLTRGKFTVVDNADYEDLMKYHWHLSNCGYAKRRNGKHDLRMHRYIAKTPTGTLTDHRNHCTLDNRRCNLRHATAWQNACNSRNAWNECGLKGATQNRSGKFRGFIRCRNQLIYLGTFSTPQLAHVAYCEAAARLHGDFACTQ